MTMSQPLPKTERRVLSFDLDIRKNLLFGCNSHGPDGIRQLLEAVIPGFREDKVGLVVAEVLEAFKGPHGFARTYIYSTHNNDEERASFKKDYFAMIDAVPRPNPDWSLSNSHLFYFGDSEAHPIFCGCVIEPAISARKTTHYPRSWNKQDFSHPLRRDYSKTFMVPISETLVFWEKYQLAFNALRLNVDQSAYFYNLLVPVCFSGPDEHNGAQRPIGAVFLAIGTDRELNERELLGVFMSVQFYWHYEHTSEAVERLFVQPLDKHRQMIELLQPPLKRISNALAQMQTDTQELRAVLYEPEESLFGSYTAIEPFFRGGSYKFDGNLAVQLLHSPGQYIQRGLVVDLKIAIAALLCAVFGQVDKLRKQKHREMLLEEARGILGSVSSQDATTGLVKDLKWLLKMEPNSSLAEFLDDGAEKPQMWATALSRIKDALFTPFKLDAQCWKPLPFQLLHRHEHLRDAQLTGALCGETNLGVVDSPVSCAAIIAFTREFCSAMAASSIKTRALCWESSDCYEAYSITFGKQCDHIVNTHRIGGIIERVLTAPKEWRIDGANYGDVTRPFVSLANKIIGVGEIWVLDSKPSSSLLSLHAPKTGFQFEMRCQRDTVQVVWRYRNN